MIKACRADEKPKECKSRDIPSRPIDILHYVLDDRYIVIRELSRNLRIHTGDENSFSGTQCNKAGDLKECIMGKFEEYAKKNSSIEKQEFYTEEKQKGFPSGDLPEPMSVTGLEEK